MKIILFESAIVVFNFMNISLVCTYSFHLSVVYGYFDEFSSVSFPRPHEILHLLQDLQFHFGLDLHWITLYCQIISHNQQQLDSKRCGNDSQVVQGCLRPF